MCRCIERSRYEKGATILTSNRGLAKWHGLGDQAVATALMTVYCTTLS
jgi:hypothetical protein